MNRPYTVTINNNIVKQKCRTIKKMALFSLKGRWLPAIGVSFALTLASRIPDLVLGFFDTPETGLDVPFFITSMISVAITGMISMSSCAYFLSVFRMQPAGKAELMTGIKYYKKAFLIGAVQFLISIVISQGMLFASLLGILTYLSWALSFFILADNPEKSGVQCLASSRFMMTGNRSKLVKLILSFAGWFLLVNFVSNIIRVAIYPGLIEEMSAVMKMIQETAASGAMLDVGALDMPISEACSRNVFLQITDQICSTGLSVFVSTSVACFYDLASGNLMTEGDKSDPVAEAMYGR